MGGGKKATVGYWYSFAFLMGVSRGPINVLRKIRVGDIQAWQGEQTENGSFQIDQPKLFGGEEKEGGIVGTFAVFMGNAGQTFSDTFKALMGGLVSDYRGVTTFTFRGKVSANNPYLKPWKFRVCRWDAGWDRDEPWYPVKAQIRMDDGRGDVIYAMNPAHILYECYTNRLWGRGQDPSELMEDYFVAAANQLCDEGFGLCFKWVRSEDINSFINTVLNHIDAVQFTDRETGKVGIRLIRADYDPDSLVVFGYNSGLLSIDEDETGGGDSAYSEVAVSYVDARTGEKARAVEHSLAIIQSLGDVASTTASYEGIPAAPLAHRVAARDLNKQATFLKKFKVVLDRRGWKLNVGNVFKVSAVDRGLVDVVLRVGAIEDSELKDGRITVTAVQDVFGLPDAGYAEPTLPGAWVPPNNEAMAVSNVRLDEVTYRDLVRTLAPADLATVDETDTQVTIFAGAPSGASVNYDIASAATGETIEVRGSGDWTMSGLLEAPVGYYDTTLRFPVGTDLSPVSAGEIVQVDGEIMGVTAVDAGLATLTVTRGTLDTIPAKHEAGAAVWFSEDALGSDDRPYTIGETVEVRLLTNTSVAGLAIEDAPSEMITVVGRQSRPYAPGAVTINGVPFGQFETDFMFADAEVAIEWTHRDRLLQADQIVEHEASSVGPEPGTTYTIEVYDDATLLRTETGITGATWTYDSSMISADGEPASEAWTFKLRSERDGQTSWQEYSMLVRRRLSTDIETGAPVSIVVTGYPPTVGASWTFEPGPTELVITGYPPVLTM